MHLFIFVNNIFLPSIVSAILHVLDVSCIFANVHGGSKGTIYFLVCSFYLFFVCFMEQ